VSGFPDEALTRDAFLGGRLRLWQPRVGYRAAIDPVLLAAFAPAVPGARALDLGCGAGTAALCLGTRVPGLDLHGLEIQPAYTDLARRNAAANGIGMEVHDGDLRRPPPDLRAMSFDLLLTNPPYHPETAPPPSDAGRDVAHREGAVSLGAWIDAGLRRLRPGGTLALIHLAARLGEILAALEGRAGAAEILPVSPRAERPAHRILVRARKGAQAPLRLWPPLTLHQGIAHGHGGDSYTEEAQRVLKRCEALLPDTRISSID
jgi:tRNA1Val (adenine37-N6)-methyltransferase